MDITTRPWMESFETLLNAINVIDSMFNRPDAHRIVQEHGFTVDRVLLKQATPYAWSKETSAALWAASAHIPDDTRMNKWNIPSTAVWWYFEEPLPIDTLELPGLKNVGVRALCIGWLNVIGEAPRIGCSAWCDSHGKVAPGVMLTPSQTWTWALGDTVADTLHKAREGHAKSYGPGGKWHNQPQLGAERFMEATDRLSRFILAGMAWIGQKILVDTAGPIERHRRKDYERKVKRPIHDVRVIRLRQSEYPKREAGAEHEPREWSCWWLVGGDEGGHWRNQACGPQWSEHRLVYILPYPKGDMTKPFKQPSTKVYEVDR